MDEKEDKYKKMLDEESYAVLRKGATEPAFSGKFYAYEKNGSYLCGACGVKLFDSSEKYDSKSGWPSFARPADQSAIEYREDDSFGIRRTEIVCAKCKSHLGHVFDDGPSELAGKPSTGKRFCVNSKSLKFSGEDGVEAG